MTTPRRLVPFLAGAVLLLLLGGSLRRLGPLPPLGPFLDPVHGAWALAAAARPPAGEAVSLVGLSAPARALVDDRGVPHIFAATELDAYRVMGYLVARDRLFQMELTARSTAGTLTEILGPRLLEVDRASRASGLAEAADRKFAALDTTSIGYRATMAYADGVNAWINRLGPGDLPLEYRLLGRRPARWEAKNTLLLFGRMGQVLAGFDPAEQHLRVQSLVGAAAADALVPVNSPIQEPIQPNGQRAPRFDLPPLPPPGAPDTAAAQLVALRDHSGPADAALEVGALGSNNWAVGPARTRDGYALLAGDPHLQLTLPAIWYEIHLNVPGQLDVAGVSMPGGPGVLIGFNRDLAWTFTNTGGDVSDLYQETVDDPAGPASYRVDGEWRPVRISVQEYRAPGGGVLAVDTLRFSHRGPMQKVGGRWFSRRWTVLEPSAETDVFLHLARARTAAEWLTQMEAYQAPTQNGLVADRGGTIAIRSSGWYPLRPGDGRGDRVFDGSSSASDWIGRLPVARYPFALAPAQGFLVSANQQPVDPIVNPAYLGADWPAPWRAIRINTLLRADSQMTPESMRRMHTDPGSARVEAFLPLILGAGRAAAAGDSAVRRAVALLEEWDGTYRPENQRAILFELAMWEASTRLFDELIPPGATGDSARPVARPELGLLAALRDSSTIWWDDRRTTGVVETGSTIIGASLRAALDTAVARYGAPDSGGWRWGAAWPTDIWHLLRLPGLSAPGLAVQGGPNTIAPAGRHGVHGPSWRMVVQLGPEVRAWSTYPGGQSGNPASPWYANRIPQWVAGQLDPVLFPATAEALEASRVRGRLTFEPGR